MFKTFALFGMICIFDPSVKIFQENCFNVWEDPAPRYKTLDECDNAGKKLGIKIRTQLENKGIIITQGELWCIETTKKQGS